MSHLIAHAERVSTNSMQTKTEAKILFAEQTMCDTRY